MPAEWQEIQPKDKVKITYQGVITEIMQQEKRNHNCPIRKINADEYYLVSSGEVKDFDKGETRFDDCNGLRKSFRKLRELLNTNIGENPERVKTIVSTYRQRDNYEQEPIPMTDTKKLYRDNELFKKKIKYQYPGVEIIEVCEPQSSGSWHTHLFLIFQEKAPYIANKTIAKMWGHGFTKTKNLDPKIDNPGAYYVAYFTDLMISDDLPQALKDEITKRKLLTKDTTKGKRAIKGARLILYPKQFQLYRTTKGIKQPQSEYKKYIEIEKSQLGKLTYQKKISMVKIVEGDALKVEEVNSVRYKYYNKVRK